MDLASLIIQLLSGAAGGNVAGGLLKNLSLGTLGNSLAGLIGGGLGATMLDSALGMGRVAAGSGLDIGTIISQIASGGVGGGVMMMIIGVIKNMMTK